MKRERELVSKKKKKEILSKDEFLRDGFSKFYSTEETLRTFYIKVLRRKRWANIFFLDLVSAEFPETTGGEKSLW